MFFIWRRRKTRTEFPFFSLLLKVLLSDFFPPSSINILRVCQGPARILSKADNSGERDKQNLPSSLKDLNKHTRFQKSIMITCKVKKTFCYRKVQAYIKSRENGLLPGFCDDQLKISDRVFQKISEEYYDYL